jgi:hypothetical protein
MRQVYWATGIGSPELETASQEIWRGKVDATAILSQLKFAGGNIMSTMKPRLEKSKESWLPGNKSQSIACQKTVIIIGAGIAGLSTGIYAQMNGYRSRIYELHTIPGGVLTAWRRKGYLIDGCVDRLAGSSPRYPRLYRYWQEIGLIQGRQIFDPEIFFRVEDRHGQAFNLYCDADRLEQHMLALAPEDEKTIREMCEAIRKFRVLRAGSADPNFCRT